MNRQGEFFAHVTYIADGDEHRTYLLHGSIEAIAAQVQSSIVTAFAYDSQVKEITVRPVSPASLWSVDAGRGPGG